MAGYKPARSNPNPKLNHFSDQQLGENQSQLNLKLLLLCLTNFILLNAHSVLLKLSILRPKFIKQLALMMTVNLVQKADSRQNIMMTK